MATESQYQVYCSNEQQYFTNWCKTRPTNCPNDYRHKLDVTKTLKLCTRNLDIQPVHIQQESVATSGFYRYKSLKFACSANSNSEYTVTFPYPITILQADTITSETHRGDKIDLYFMTSNNTLGKPLSNISIGDNIIPVENSVINYMANGFECIITDGSNTDNLGEIINIQATSNLLYTQFSSSNTYDSNSSVKYRFPIIQDMWITEPRIHTVGAKKITGSSVPANAKLIMIYANNSSNVDKEIIVDLEYMY